MGTGAIASPAAAKPAAVKVPVPAAGQVSVLVASVKGTPKLRPGAVPTGVTVAGAAARGRLELMVVRPHGAPGGGRVTVRAGRVKGVKTFRAALTTGTAPRAACAGLAGRLGRTLRLGDATKDDVRDLAAALAARLCGGLPPADVAALLHRLALDGGVAPQPTGGVQLPPPSPPPAPPAPPAGTGGTPPAPGGISAACAQAAAVSQGDEPTTLYAAINHDCGTFTKVELTVSPAPASCTALTAASNFACTISGSTARAASKDGKATDTIDLPITLTGPANCAAKATFTITRVDGSKGTLTEAIGGCGAGTAKPVCANGKDDDGDGQIDDRDAPGATNPDPGCGSTTDATEDSELDPPAGCEVTWGTFDADGFFPGIEITGCGPLLTAWIRPPGTPDACQVAIGAGDWRECEIRGATVSSPLAETEEHVALAAHLPDGIQCEPATAAIVRNDGKVFELLAEVPGC